MRRFYDVKGKNLQISALTMAGSRVWERSQRSNK